MTRAALAAATLLLAAFLAAPPGSAAPCPAVHQGLGEIHGEAFGGLFVIGDWVEGCDSSLGCSDAAHGSTHGLEGFPMGPFEVTEQFEFAIGCVVECAFPAFGIAYRGPGGGVFPGVDEWGQPMVTFDCPGGFHGEMRQNAF